MICLSKIACAVLSILIRFHELIQKTLLRWIKHIDICWYSHSNYGLKAYRGAVKCRKVSAELQKTTLLRPVRVIKVQPQSSKWSASVFQSFTRAGDKQGRNREDEDSFLCCASSCAVSREQQQRLFHAPFTVLYLSARPFAQHSWTVMTLRTSDFLLHRKWTRALQRWRAV